MDYNDELNCYRLFRKTRYVAKVKETEQGEPSDEDSSHDDNDHSSDEDFSLHNKKRKRKRKKMKPVEREKKRRLPKQKIMVPTFDQVLAAQIQHASKFINSDESEADEIIEDGEQPIQEASEQKSREPLPQPIITHKRRKIVIHPWSPIGITGGRPPNNM